MFNNICDTDSYKFQHFNMYPEGTQKIYSYFENRKGALFPAVRFFGLQYILNQLAVPITVNQLEEEFNMSVFHGVEINKKGFQRLIDKHKGRFPVIIKALPEGLVCPISTCLITIENTDPEFPWLTNYIETQLSRVWYPITVCTISWEIKRLLLHYADLTADNNDFVKFQLHDFGSRGVTCREQAGIGGMAHLVNFKGTDNVMGMKFAHRYYNAPLFAGLSVPASEHSIMTALGKDGEEQIFKNCLSAYPDGILSIVIDSYDWVNFVTNYSRKLKEQIIRRNGKLVFRPDSGDPVKVSLDLFNILAEIFGYTYNKKGFKELNPKVGILWGDGIDIDGIHSICHAFYEHKISISNIVFGSGGGLLQRMNRDTLNCAFKCSAIEINNKWYDVFKDPVDIEYCKVSKKGKLKVIKFNNEIQTVPQNDSPGLLDILETVFKDGKIVKKYRWDEVVYGY